MNNLGSIEGFVELSQNELLTINGGEGFWSDVWEGIKDFFRGFSDALRDFSLPM